MFCIVFEKAVREILFLTVFFQNLADLWRKYPFYLNLRYVPTSSNPADFFTRHILDYPSLLNRFSYFTLWFVLGLLLFGLVSLFGIVQCLPIAL